MMIEAGARVNVADDHGRTPLHYAAQAGNYKYVKELLKAGADVKAMDMDGATPLLMQSSCNCHEVTQLLVCAGADLTASAKNCRESYIVHLKLGAPQTLTIFLISGLQPEVVITRATPFYTLQPHVAETDDEVEILLRAGANPTTKDNKGNTPLHIASNVGNAKVMELLIKAGIDFTLKDVINQTSLKWTSSVEGVEHADHVRNQRKAAIIDEKNNEGQTPLLLAAGCRDAVSLLLREGASISVKDHSGKTPLQVAINQGSHRAVRLLWAAGSNFLDIPQECRNRAVHLAVTSGDLEVLEHLISLGLSMSDNWWDPDHKTTLLHCAAKCNVEMLKYLKNQDYMEHFLDYKGRTALHCAVLSSNHIVAKYLLEEAHVLVDERDADGMTALMLAASNMQYYDKQFDMFEILVNEGADVNIRDRNGKAIYEMVDYTRADMTKELLDYMQYRL
ncbi:serine/threonine-protein phosphatase 6 regulatory ankyrin repeat subunit C-like [Schistocerca americana]|uniref:serine/threonine-protein phosphatase 6 regulatory ankyrin repeat subunit C-like n=1 Tax=Schistocerca americana TaxID=7009 RepID=UPI001F4FD78F|nr:serine/threonine-protein phosphatase 6 regulatory ankyrin repeat subunit C-like [Schistocerca americana]